jgi:hypothetical protein
MITYLVVQMGNAYDTTGYIGMLNNTTIIGKCLKLVLVKQQDMNGIRLNCDALNSG